MGIRSRACRRGTDRANIGQGQDRRGQSLRTGRQGHLHRCQSIGGGIVSDRLASRFAKCRAEGRAALVIFVTGGAPPPNDMAVVLESMVLGGSDMIELGMSFPDQLSAGPALQVAAPVTQHAVWGKRG